jgi:RimJ/RimL family protein N-acetyltransferase
MTSYPTLNETYRQLVNLQGGVRVLLRPLVAEDEEALVALFSAVQPEDLRSMRHAVTDPRVVRNWIEDLDYERVLPLLAVVNDRIVGQATLHRQPGPAQHIGEVRIYLAKDYRGRGLGSEMIKTLTDMARRMDLHWLHAEVFASRPKVVRAFEGLGFQQLCTFEDNFMMPDGHTEDIVVLRMRLLERTDEF